MDKWADWLLSEAGAGWVIGILSLLALILTNIRRVRPQRVLCREVGTYRLASLAHAARTRLAVLFDGQPVEMPSQLLVEILNEGFKTIKHVVLVMEFPCYTKVLCAEANTLPEHFETSVSIISPNKVRVSTPFLNPFREHKHSIRVSFVCDGPPLCVKVVGGGVDWSVRHIGQATARVSKRLAIGTFLLLAEGVGGLFFLARMSTLVTRGHLYAGGALLALILISYAWTGIPIWRWLRLRLDPPPLFSAPLRSTGPEGKPATESIQNCKSDRRSL